MFPESILKFGKPYKAREALSQLMSENTYKGQQLEQQQKEPRSMVTEGRRSVLQIRVDILRVIMEGYGKPTQVMYKANLSWNVLQSQLKSFLETDMLTVEEYGSRRKYAITPKGVEMVRSYQKVVDEILG
jgi:predicted transcriptional regulator